MTFKLTVLGSGAWEGIPSPFGTSRIDQLAKKAPSSKDNRTRPEFLVETDVGSFLIEISPDIRLQSTRFNLVKIRDFVISHWHFDHLFGLYELHAWSEIQMDGKINVFCSQETSKFIEKQIAFIPKTVVVVKPFGTFSLRGTKITALPVSHMYKRDNGIPEDKLDNAFGYLIEYKRRKIVYLGDYYAIPKKTMNLIKDADLVIADGTYLFEKRFPDNKWQNELKRDQDHMHGDDIINFVRGLNAKKIIFHSISSLSDLNHKEMQNLLGKNMFISYDGMKLELDTTKG